MLRRRWCFVGAYRRLRDAGRAALQDAAAEGLRRGVAFGFRGVSMTRHHAAAIFGLLRRRRSFGRGQRLRRTSRCGVLETPVPFESSSFFFAPYFEAPPTMGRNSLPSRFCTGRRDSCVMQHLNMTGPFVTCSRELKYDSTIVNKCAFCSVSAIRRTSTQVCLVQWTKNNVHAIPSSSF